MGRGRGAERGGDRDGGMGQDGTLCSSVWHQDRVLLLENASKDIELQGPSGKVYLGGRDLSGCL